VLFAFGLFGIFGAVLWALWKGRLQRLLAIASALVATVTAFMAYSSRQVEEEAVLYLSVCCAAYAIFILIAIVTIGRDVLFRERVTADCILGGICVYLFLGMFFSFLFGICSLQIPGAFDFGGESAKGIAVNHILYFSYITLTTAGYGDILPLHPFVRMLAAFESITGTLYIAIMISRLVGLHLAHKHAAKS
jgi:hypothetical protein